MIHRKMHIAVLSSPDNWYVADLRRAAGDSCTISVVDFRELHSHICDAAVVSAGVLPLNKADVVLARAMPAGSLEQVVFRMDALARLEAEGTPVVNPPKAIEAAVDKYLATARLHAADLLVPRTFACQSVEAAMEAFAQLGGDVVVKPLFGAEGRGIFRLQEEMLARGVFESLAQLGAVIYLQEFIEHPGEDYRLLVIGDRVLGMRRRNPHDWRTNISRGAVGEPLQLTAEISELALRAAAAVGAPLAGVDILPGLDSRFYAIEVNASPGWKSLSSVCGVDVAAMVVDHLKSVALDRYRLNHPMESLSAL